jgi:hypothetical protein
MLEVREMREKERAGGEVQDQHRTTMASGREHGSSVMYHGREKPCGLFNVNTACMNSNA